MELDELKAGWAEFDRRLERIEAAVAVSGRRRGVKAELRALVAWQLIQLIAGLMLAVAAGSFWVDHRAQPSLLVTGVLLHLYGVAMIIAAVRTLVLVARVDEASPVLTLQARIADLRAWRIREGRWFGVAGCFMWVAMVIWAFGLLGVDVVAANPAFVGLQLITAVVCLGVFIVVSRLDGKPEGSAVRRAQERLDEIERFRAG
ncbi:hypothetical protein [Dyella sp. 333MFSha]|uniref:hypothetical protein n=1 Tax=Dyella sp. 333MFSha TaxID=1798240 RepID=UPI0008812C9D|nr:hypothetical protein [Dyella sp. 333MFSha]SDH01793.1 hypothetical protein SAMN04515659_3974 [Dyella sp. 333MFSha]